jgi:hypothetical protein
VIWWKAGFFFFFFKNLIFFLAKGPLVVKDQISQRNSETMGLAKI